MRPAELASGGKKVEGSHDGANPSVAYVRSITVSVRARSIASRSRSQHSTLAFFLLASGLLVSFGPRSPVPHDSPSLQCKDALYLSVVRHCEISSGVRWRNSQDQGNIFFVDGYGLPSSSLSCRRLSTSFL